MYRIIRAGTVMLAYLAVLPILGEVEPAEIRLRDLEMKGLIVETGALTLTATFDVPIVREWESVSEH